MAPADAEYQEVGMLSMANAVVVVFIAAERGDAARFDALLLVFGVELSPLTHRLENRPLLPQFEHMNALRLVRPDNTYQALQCGQVR